MKNSRQILFLYPYDRKTTIGGVSSTQDEAEKWFERNEYKVISLNYLKTSKEDIQELFNNGCKVVVCCNKDYKLFDLLKSIGYKIFLIGHSCCWVTFYNDPCDSGYQLDTIGNFMSYIRNGVIDYIPLTDNDAILYEYLFGSIKPVGINPHIPRFEFKEVTNTGRHNVGMIGRIAPEKNHEDFIKMAKSVPEWNWIFTCAIDKHYEQYYNSIIKKLNNEVNIIKFYPDELEKFWSNIDVLVLPSKHEASPVVFFEALRRGIPIVAYDNITPDYSQFENVISVVPQGYYHDAIEELDYLIKERHKDSRKMYDLCNKLVDTYYEKHYTWMDIIHLYFTLNGDN